MPENNKMEIFFTIDNGYAGMLAACIASILISSDDSDRFSFSVINHDLSKENKRKLEKLSEIKSFTLKFFTVKKEILDRIPQSISKHITSSTNARLFVAELAPNLDKALFLDCDLVVLQSLADLWNLPIDNYYMAAVPDPLMITETPSWSSQIDELPHEHIYMNTGVTLFNLKKWREDQVAERFIKAGEKYASKLRYPDQDLLNIALHTATLEISHQWNYSATLPNNMKPANYDHVKPGVVHWVGFRKPWLQPVRPFSDYFWNFARVTPFYEELLAKYIDSGVVKPGISAVDTPSLQALSDPIPDHDFSVSQSYLHPWLESRWCKLLIKLIPDCIKNQIKRLL